MTEFTQFLAKIDDPLHRERMDEVLTWVKDRYPNLKREIKWNQPMYTDHGTFIIGFSVSKKHIAVAPERVTITQFTDHITKAGYEHTKELIRMPWKNPVDYSLLADLIDFNIQDKANCTTFWRRND